MNPYDFVPLVGNPDHVRRAPDTHERYAEGTFTGRLVCRLTTLTPLFVYNHRNVSKTSQGHEWARSMTAGNDKTPIIPGTSLKGVIRSVVEAVSPSCFPFYQIGNPPKWQKNYHYELPDGFAKCTEIHHLCPSCRLFGMVGSGDGNVFMGKVAIRDAMPEQFKWGEETTLAVLSTPKVRHRAFYQGRGEYIAGRKFYFHSTEVQERGKQDNQNKTIMPIAKDATFTFSVDVVNLSADELGLLLYALALEKDMAHKIGMGKPVGLGSVRIEITCLQESDMHTRYQEWSNSGFYSREDQELAQFISDRIQGFRESESENIVALRRIWRFKHGMKIHYPDWKWFEANPHVPIADTP